jgi:hypothetical protein
MQCAVGEHFDFDFIKLLNFSFILLVLCKYFDFIPTYVLFCMCGRPPPPPRVWDRGWEMLIDLTLSLCSFTPPPPFPEHIWASLLSLIIPTPLSSDNTVVIFPLQTAFREHYANICTFLRTFSCSISLLFVCANFYQFFANIMQTFGHFCKHFRAAFIIAPCLGSICPSQYMWISSDDALQYVFLC